MENLTFGEVLGKFKSNEDVENIIPIMNNPELQSSVIAWKSVKVSFVNAGETCSFDDPNDQWAWLWKHVSYDVASFAVVAGLRQQDAGRILLRLIGLHLIYPDGTINSCAKIYMQGLFKANLNHMAGGKPGRPKKVTN